MREITLYPVHILIELGAFFFMFLLHCFDMPYQFFVLTFKGGYALLQFLPFRFQLIAAQKRTYLCNKCRFRLGLGGQQFPEIFNVGVPLRLLSKRPDVREAEMTLASAYYTTNQARSAFYPNLTLSGSAGWTNALGQVVTNPGGWILSAVASLTQPIFNRGKLVSNLRVSKDEEQIALLNYKQTLLDAGQEVSDALYAVESAQRNLDIHQKQCRELERTVETSTALYKTGNATYLELLTAQQSLLNARLNMVSDSFTHCQSVITLYRALGGGSN